MNRLSSSSDSENGQAILLMAVLMVTLLSFTALAIDGGRLYLQRRDAQNAADSAALAAARADCSDLNITQAAERWIAKNGYKKTDSSVGITVQNPPAGGTFQNQTYYTDVIITKTIPSSFAQLIFPGALATSVRSTGHCKPTFTAFAGSQTCNNAIDMSSSNLTYSGGLHSNHDINVSGGGQGNMIQGKTTYVTSVQSGNNTVFVPSDNNPKQISVQAYPVTVNVQDYAPGGVKALAAQAAGKYYSCNCDMDKSWLQSQGLYDTNTKLLKDGLYYTSQDIDAGFQAIGTSVTFVARGKIDWHGSTIVLTSYVDNLLFYTDYNLLPNCSSPVINLSGSNLAFTGNLFGPNGQIDVSTSNLNLNGKLMANTINAHGSTLTMRSPAVAYIELAQ